MRPFHARIAQPHQAKGGQIKQRPITGPRCKQAGRIGAGRADGIAEFGAYLVIWA